MRIRIAAALGLFLVASSTGWAHDSFDFDSPELKTAAPGWGFAPRGDATFQIVAGGPGGAGDRCLRMDSLGSGRPAFLDCPFRAKSTGVVAFDIKLVGKAGVEFHLARLAGPSVRKSYGPRLALNAKDGLVCKTPDGPRVVFPADKLAPDRWHRLMLFFYSQEGTFDVIVDDALFKERLPYFGDAPEVNNLRLYLGRRRQKRRVMLDNVCVGTLAGPAMRPVLRVGRAAGAIRVDGRFDDPGWRGAGDCVGFLVYRKVRPVPACRQGVFRLARDEKNVYFRFSVALGKGYDGKRDAVELFLQPLADGPRYQWILTGKGECLSYVDGRRIPAPAGLRAVSGIARGRFHAELAVPFAAMKLARSPLEEQSWRVNVCFNDGRTGELSAWTFMDADAKGFRDTRYFAKALFPKSSTAGEIQRGFVDTDRMMRKELIGNGDLDPVKGGNAPWGWELSKTAVFEETVQLSGDYCVAGAADGVLARARIGLKFPGTRKYKLKAALAAAAGAKAVVRIRFTTGDGKKEVADFFADAKPSSRYAPFRADVVFPAGTRSVDSVELVKLGGTRAGFARVSLGSMREELRIGHVRTLRPDPLRVAGEKPLATPCERWAATLAGGPIRTLFLVSAARSYVRERTAVEIAQRIELDYDYVIVWSGKLYSFHPERVAARLRRSQYEVIVTNLPASEDFFWSAVTAKVADGAGLVVTTALPSGTPVRGEKTIFDHTAPKNADHPVRGSLPLGLLPNKKRYSYLPKITVSKLGKGRVVNFKLSDVKIPGLYPSREDEYLAYRAYSWPYWEIYYSCMAKAIKWAARGDRGVRVKAAVAGKGKARRLELAVEGAPVGARLKVEHRDPFWKKVGAAGASLTGARAHIPLGGSETSGTHFANAWLVDKDGKVLWWDTLAFEGGRAEKIVDLAPGKTRYEPGEEVTIGGKILNASPGAARYELRYALVDHRGRTLARARAGFSASVAIRFTPRGVIGNEAVFRLDLFAGEELAASARTYVNFKKDVTEALDDYTFNILITHSSSAAYPAHVIPHIYPILRDIGVNAVAGGGYDLGGWQYYLEGDFLSSHWSYRSPKYGRVDRAFYDSAAVIPPGIRKNCLNDPRLVEKIKNVHRDFGRCCAIINPAMLVIADEAALNNGAVTLDVCRSKHCRAAFVEWLKASYKNLDALNGQWGTAYKDWEDVEFVGYKEIRKRANYSQWADWREFMEVTWARRSWDCAEAVKESSPETIVGYENTRAQDFFAGWDLELMSRGLDLMGTYNKEGSRDRFTRPRFHNHVREMVRSFFGHKKQMGWYGYGADFEVLEYQPWFWAIHGGSGISLYRFSRWEHGYYHPDLRPTKSWGKIREIMKDLVTGAGKLLAHLDRAPCGVAMLYSQESMRISWAQSATHDKRETTQREPYGAFHASREYFRYLIEDAQHQFDYLSPRLIADGRLKGYSLLILCHAPAISASTREAVRRFVASGGTVLATLDCARFDRHGKPTGDGWLRSVFGVTRAERPIEYEAKKFDWDGAELEFVGREAVRPAGAKVLARHADGTPALTENALGSGRAVYMNFLPPPYDVSSPEFARMQKFLTALLERARVERPCLVTRPNGRRMHHIEVVAYDDGGSSLLAIQHDYRYPEAAGEMRVKLPAKFHVFDVRAAKKIAHADVVALNLHPGQTVLLALTDAEPSAPVLEAPKRAVAGDRLQIPVRVPGGERILYDVCRIEVTAPDGARLTHYDKNVALSGGKGVFVLPTAPSDPSGNWRIRARDVLTGKRADVPLEISPFRFE